ncbi:MAG: hypothetical protein ABI823_05560 [Bryobacteraceae bacterium]
MKITRRNLAGLMTAAVVAAPQAAVSQSPPASADPDDATAARAALKANLETLAKAEVPIATEPATQFRA